MWVVYTTPDGVYLTPNAQARNNTALASKMKVHPEMLLKTRGRAPDFARSTAWMIRNGLQIGQGSVL